MSSGLLLVVLGLFGSGALALMAFAMGFSRDLKIANADEVAAHVATYAPGTTLLATAIDRTQKMALVLCSDTKLYLLVSMGDKMSVRALLPSQVQHQTGARVRIDLGDLGVPTLDFHSDHANLAAVFGVLRTGAPQ